MQRTKYASRILAVLLALALAAGFMPAAAFADGASPDYTAALAASLSYIENTVADPAVGSVGGEWAVLALARGGVTNADWNSAYLASLDSAIAGGSLTKMTDYARVTLALSSLGMDASAYKGTDLTSAFSAFEAKADRAAGDQSIMADIFALLALDSMPYTGDAQDYADAILAAQWSISDSAWGVGVSPDADTTAMAIQALAPYYGSDPDVASAVDGALDWLGSQTLSSAESNAQAIIALCAVDTDPAAYVGALLTYFDASDGAFAHVSGGADNEMATEQAAYALVAYDRYLKGGSALYDMSDAFGAVQSEITISYQADSNGFAIARRTFDVSSDLAERYGYTDAFDGKQVSALDAVVAATVALYGDDRDTVNSKLGVSGSFIDNFMGDGAGNVMYYVNGESPAVGVTEQQLNYGDTLELFAVRDTTNWSDQYSFFKSNGARTGAIDAAAGQPFTLLLATTLTDWDTMETTQVPVSDADIVQVYQDSAGYGAAFADCAITTGDDGSFTMAFAQPGTYVLSAIEANGPAPLMAPWLAVTVTSPFTDVGESDWSYDAVNYVNGFGLMQGVGNGLFAPGESVTRGMLVTILYRSEGEPDVSGGRSFTDVQAGRYYTDAVEWAAANGIVTGYGDGAFGPDDPVTREQFATILFNYAKYRNFDLSPAANLPSLGYKDADDVSSWALPAMNWAVGIDMINGVTATTLVPGGAATRAQAAAMLMRFFDNYGRLDF